MIGLIKIQVISKKNSKAKGIKNISSMHEFFYRQSDIKVGGSENNIKNKPGKEFLHLYLYYISSKL